MSTPEIRVCQFLKIEPSTGGVKYYQNYFIGESKAFGGDNYDFAPFEIEGGVSSLNADNQQVTLLFPASGYAVRLVESGDGNRLSRLTVFTRFINGNGLIRSGGLDEHYVGIGASFSDDTIELRFRSALDGVAAGFPASTLTERNVGILPLESTLSLR
tara:strand:- start:272 stop:745 length:474 start_codon:yes stop_codon:yes gene_type:complete